jgi:hypothetical protein
LFKRFSIAESQHRNEDDGDISLLRKYDAALIESCSAAGSG